MNRKLLFTLFVVAVLAMVIAVPVMASSSMIGTHEIVVRSSLESASVLVTTAPAEPVIFQPKQPMLHYTCYYEGIRIPCSFLRWLWDPWF